MAWSRWSVSGQTPTQPEIAREMMRVAGVGADDVVYDLGCGKGSIVIAAAQLGARAIGVDTCHESLSVAMTKAANAGVSDRVRFIEADLLSFEFSDATVVALYLLPSYLEKLRPKLLRLRPGTRVVSHSFDMGDWPPHSTVKFNGRVLHYWVVPGKDDPPSPTILTRTLDYLTEQAGHGARSIRDLRLADHLIAVVLDDQSVGVSTNDVRLGEYQWARIRHSLLRQLPEDPLLLRTTELLAPGGGIAGSIRTAVANALSFRAIVAGDDPYFTCSGEFPHHFFKGTNMALVTEVGGLLDYLINRTTAKYVHVCDIHYASRREQGEPSLEQFRRRGGVQLSISDDKDVLHRIRQADLVVISDATLGNGSFDGLLPACARSQRVVLEGPAAAIHPRYLFESGVDLIVTTRIDAEVAAAVLDESGQVSLATIQQKSPWVYLAPSDLKN